MNNIAYRRSMQELPASAEEAHLTQEEGISFNLPVNPVRILGDGKVSTPGAVKGAAIVILAMGAGKTATQAIDVFIRSKK